MTRRLLPLLNLLLCACGAVAPSLDEHSGGDANRPEALGVFIDRTVTDQISPEEGDHTDWKYLDVLDKGQLRWKIAINQPERLQGGEISFHDEFGETLERRLISKNQTSYVFAWEVKKAPSKFFIRVFGQEGVKAVYSTGATLALAAPPPPPPVVAVAPPPPPEPEPTPQPRKRYTKRTVKPPPPPPPPPEPTPTAGPTVVDGLIVRVTPSDDNTSVTISARLKGKVRKGASGQVMRNGKPLPGGAFRVSNARGRNVDAKVNLPEGRFTGRLTVQVQGD